MGIKQFGGGVAAAASNPTVLTNDNVSAALTTPIGVVKTYTGITFSAATMFKITIFYETGINNAGPAELAIRVGDGTNTTDFSTVDGGALGVNDEGHAVFYISQQDSATTTAGSCRGLIINRRPPNSTLTAANSDNITLTGGGTWATQDRIIIRANFAGGAGMTLKRVLIERFT